MMLYIIYLIITRYDTYDVTSMLLSGSSNALAIALGKGFYAHPAYNLVCIVSILLEPGHDEPRPAVVEAKMRRVAHYCVCCPPRRARASRTLYVVCASSIGGPFAVVRGSNMHARLTN